MAGPLSQRKREGRFGKKLGGQYVDRNFYRGVSDPTGSVLKCKNQIIVGSVGAWTFIVKKGLART